MFVEDIKVHLLVREVVRAVAPDGQWHDDLVQEALVHFVRIERAQPGQTLGWYLQSCRFHVRDWLRRGRSLDALKRRHLGRSFDERGAGSDSGSRPEPMARDGNVVEEVSARDVLNQLNQRLGPLDRLILGELVSGAGVRETARQLALSHPAIVQRRHRIAAVATRLGFFP